MTKDDLLKIWVVFAERARATEDMGEVTKIWSEAENRFREIDGEDARACEKDAHWLRGGQWLG